MVFSILEKVIQKSLTIKVTVVRTGGSILRDVGVLLGDQEFDAVLIECADISAGMIADVATHHNQTKIHVVEKLGVVRNSNPLFRGLTPEAYKALFNLLGEDLCPRGILKKEIRLLVICEAEGWWVSPEIFSPQSPCNLNFFIEPGDGSCIELFTSKGNKGLHFVSLVGLRR